MEHNINNIADIATAIGSIATALTFIVAVVQLNRNNKIYLDQKKESTELQILNNSILVKQMWNEYNRMIIEGDEALRLSVGIHDFKGVDTALIRRVFFVFSRLNIMECIWSLNKIGLADSNDVATNLNDHCILLARDKEAVKLALSGRGYTKDFIEYFWPRIMGTTDGMPISSNTK